MRALNWNITQFNHIFSYPADADGGAEAYAQDMVNLRVDRWGNLRQRPAIKPLTMANANGIAPDGISITGVAAGARQLAWMRSDGRLYLADGAPATPVEVRGITGMSGQLSLVEVADVVIIAASHGAGRAHVAKGNKAEALGIDAPQVSKFGTQFFGGSDSTLSSVIASFGQRITKLPVSPIHDRIYVFSADDSNVRTDAGGNSVTVRDHATKAAITTAAAGELYLPTTESWGIVASQPQGRGNVGSTSMKVGALARAPQTGDVFTAPGATTRYRVTAVTADQISGQYSIDFTPGLTALITITNGGNLTVVNIWERITIPMQDEYTYYRLKWRGEGLLGEVESEQSNFVAVRLPDRSSNANDFASNNQQLVVEITAKPGDQRVGRVELYRSGTAEEDGDNDEGLVYYRVAEGDLPENTGHYPFYLVDQTVGELDATAVMRDTTLIPADAQIIQLFNDRLFTVHDNELRFSEVNYGIPEWHAFPILNAIRADSRIEFCAAYRGVLLFGGADGLYRLSGTSPANFRYDRISARGPVSPYAWAILSNAFAFVGADGLYFTDGTQAPEAAPQLKGFFNRYDIESGFVGMLPNKASLWGVTRRNKETDALDTVYFVNEDGNWTRLEEGTDGTTIRQYASVKFDGHALTGVIADQQNAPRLIDWVVDDSTLDGVTEYIGQTDPPTQPIHWLWESQRLDWGSQGVGEEMKTFEELRISGNAAAPVVVKVTIDDQTPTTMTVNLNRTGASRFDPVRKRIGRRGFACRIGLSGAGEIALRGLMVQGVV